jgi:hypothetical protein
MERELNALVDTGAAASTPVLAGLYTTVLNRQLEQNRAPGWLRRSIRQSFGLKPAGEKFRILANYNYVLIDDANIGAIIADAQDVALPRGEAAAAPLPFAEAEGEA